jgi:predicted DNA-binding protein YlxM (UPF0122 family)
MLDTTKRRQRRLRLLDHYGPLLTAHQRRIMHLAWEEDWSYGEIAQRERVSRAAIYDLTRRTAQSLEGYERRLGLDRDRAARARSATRLRERLALVERHMDALLRLIERTA